MRSVQLVSIIMVLYIVPLSNVTAFGKQKHLGADEPGTTNVEDKGVVAQKKMSKDAHSDVDTPDQLCLDDCKKAMDCAALCRHLPAVNHLAIKNGVGIFFRNELLLGLVRDKGFLKSKRDSPEPYLACLETDILDIQDIQAEGGWGEYAIEFSQVNNSEGVFNGSSPEIYDGQHPLTRQRMDYDKFVITHNETGFKLDNGHIFAVFDPANKSLWHPWFLTPDKLEKEYELAVKDNRAGGGPKMLLGENHIANLPSTLEKLRTLMKKAPEANNPKGRIGEVYPNFAAAKKERYRYKEFKWYGQMIYAPSISEDILKADYGADCLPHGSKK